MSIQFPTNGTYFEQKKYVDNLRTAKVKDLAIRSAINMIKKNPMSTMPEQLPNGVDVKIFKHSIRKKDGNECPSYSITRRDIKTENSGDSKNMTDIQTTFFDNGNKHILRFVVGVDGIPKIFKVDKSLDELTEGIKPSYSQAFIINVKKEKKSVYTSKEV